MKDLLHKKDEKKKARHVRALYTDKLEIPIEHIDREDEPFATGKVGTDVYRATYQGEKVAMKVVQRKQRRVDREFQEKQFKKEIAVQASLFAPRVVKIYGACTREKDCLVVVMEFAAQRSLRDVLDRRHPLAPAERVRVLLDVAYALEYMHSQDPAAVHGDLKSPNILVMHDGAAKVADFGCARTRTLTSSSSSEPTTGRR